MALLFAFWFLASGVFCLIKAKNSLEAISEKALVVTGILCILLSLIAFYLYKMKM